MTLSRYTENPPVKSPKRKEYSQIPIGNRDPPSTELWWRRIQDKHTGTHTYTLMIGRVKLEISV